MPRTLCATTRLRKRSGATTSALAGVRTAAADEVPCRGQDGGPDDGLHQTAEQEDREAVVDRPGPGAVDGQLEPDQAAGEHDRLADDERRERGDDAAVAAQLGHPADDAG